MKFHKGLIGEDIFATIFVIILIFVLIISINNIYVTYLNFQDIFERDRTAFSIAKYIYLTNNGVIDIQKISNCNNWNYEKVYIEFYVDGIKKNSCPSNIPETEIVSRSMPINFIENGNYKPGKVVVYVSK
ncbi:MAG: hypothetical protein QXO19_03280 [Candidatus Aenigmatarchaeota archaeon]